MDLCQHFEQKATEPHRGFSYTGRCRYARRVRPVCTAMHGIIIGAMMAIGRLSARGAKTLICGQTSPAFELCDQDGKLHKLGDYRGRWVVLYFYPKDDTPGCTKEACRFRDDYSALQALDAEILGVSLDGRASHARFARKYRLPFPLLSDPDGATSRAYGALWSLGPIKFAHRHSFLIDPNGNLAKIYRRVDADTHNVQIRDELEAIRKRPTVL